MPRLDGMITPRATLSLLICLFSLISIGISGCANTGRSNPAEAVPKVAGVSSRNPSSAAEAWPTAETRPVRHASKDRSDRLVQTAAYSTTPAVRVAPVPAKGLSSADAALVEAAAVAPADLSDEAAPHVKMNLPTALAMVGGQHPVVGVARWQVREAYARLARAETLWLPTIQAGFSFHRRDGNYQASNGDIVDVNRNSFQYGLGAGATGAGTTQQPGLIAQFHLADAIFEPQIAEKTAWARGHAAGAMLNQQLLSAATAYLELLAAHQDARIIESSRDRMSELADLTADFAEAGEGLLADADRLVTERMLMENRVVAANEQIAVASAQLAQAISLDARYPIVPTEPTVAPLEWVAPSDEQTQLVQIGLTTRPELKESQALVAAACEAYRREKVAPLVPSVLLGYSTGGFGGGLGGDLDNVDSRYDFDAVVLWQVRQFGFGEKAARRETSARVQQARFEKLRVMDEIARQVSEASSRVKFRRRQVQITRRAIDSAESSYRHNLERIRDAEGLPLEVLQSVQALESARRAYLQAVVDYNRAQLQLQWALGWPVDEVSGPAGQAAAES